MANQKRMHSGHMKHAIKDVAAKGVEGRGAISERDVPRVNPGAAGGVGANAPKDTQAPPTPQPRPGGSAPKGSAKL